MGDLVKNFNYKEFRPKDSNELWKPAFFLQDLMIKELARNLQIVRDIYNKPLSINSGVREASDFSRLLAEGYHPSPTSDHFCCNVVPIEIMDPKFKRFGSYYSFSVGAADVGSDNSEELFKLGISLNQTNRTDFGQIIWEKDPIKKTEWVHFANNRVKFFSKVIADLVSIDKYLYTIDGGKNYSIYKV